jgi:hypothetical protein
VSKRNQIGGNIDYKVISHIQTAGVDIVIPNVGPSGSSSLLGVWAGLELGYDRIVMCGCPLIGKNTFGRDYNKQYARGWVHACNRIKPFVRSMSGWTRDLIGKPTKEWIYGHNTERNEAGSV